jgi:hypothetical protein
MSPLTVFGLFAVTAMLRTRKSQRVFYSRVCCCVLSGVGLWIPPRGVAVWDRGGWVVGHRGASLVVSRKATLSRNDVWNAATRKDATRSAGRRDGVRQS